MLTAVAPRAPGVVPATAVQPRTPSGLDVSVATSTSLALNRTVLPEGVNSTTCLRVGSMRQVTPPLRLLSVFALMATLPSASMVAALFSSSEAAPAAVRLASSEPPMRRSWPLNRSAPSRLTSVPVPRSRLSRAAIVPAVFTPPRVSALLFTVPAAMESRSP